MLRVCLGQSLSRRELRPPEKEVGPTQTLELDRLQLHICVDGGNGNPSLPALLGSTYKEHCMEMGIKAHVIHLSQGNPKTPSCGLDASDRANLLAYVLSVCQRLDLQSLGLWGTWQDL